MDGWVRAQSTCHLSPASLTRRPRLPTCCSAAMTPVKNKLHAWLKEKDMDWPDLVGI
jgi:hypothetical protein